MAADAAPIPAVDVEAADARRARARADAHLSGLAGVALVLPGDEARAIEERTQQWNSALKPVNVVDLWVTERISYHSLRLEDCEHRAIALRLAQARRAELGWDADRRRAAESLAARLPRDPARVAGLLASTLQGADWLLARWDAMAAILDAGHTWADAHRTLALDLLGVPAEFRTGRTPLDPAPGDAAPAHLRAVVAAEARRLRDLRAAALVELDDRDRALARLGKGPESPELAETRRDHRFHARQLQTYRAMLNGGLRPLRPAGRPWTPPPAPVPAPEPEPRWREDPPAGTPAADFAAVLAAARGLIPAAPAEPALPIAAGVAPGSGGPAGGPAPNRQARRAATLKARRRNPAAREPASGGR